MEYSRDSFAGNNPAGTPLPYVKGGKRGLIFLIVILVHAGILIIPFLLHTLQKLILPKPLKVEKVSLVESLPNDNLTPSPAPSPKAKQHTGMPDLGPELPDLPDPLPEPPAPKVQPKPQPKPQPKVQPQPKVEPRPVPQKEVKKVMVAPKVVKPKPKKRYVDAKDIKVSRKIVRRNAKNTAAIENSAGNRRNNAHARNIQSLLNNYNRNTSPHGKKGSRGTPGGAGGPKNLTANDLSRYYASVTSFMKRLWVQPHVSALRGSRPTVDVELNVDASGRIVSARILRKSGNYAMDNSVENLLRALKVLPKPPFPMPHLRVTVEIEDQ